MEKQTGRETAHTVWLTMLSVGHTEYRRIVGFLLYTGLERCVIIWDHIIGLLLHSGLERCVIIWDHIIGLLLYSGLERCVIGWDAIL